MGRKGIYGDMEINIVNDVEREEGEKNKILEKGCKKEEGWGFH